MPLKHIRVRIFSSVLVRKCAVSGWKKGYETVCALSLACRLPVRELMALEIGRFKNLSTVFFLAKFYRKRIRVEFF